MRVSLIVTTYNRADALDLVLQSALTQSRPPDEIVVADDGSGETTRRIVKKRAEMSGIPILHAWQEDIGFRAAMVRNRAIAMSSGDYLIMIDGDMVLHHDFVADHLKAAEQGHFVQGSRVLLDERTTQKAIENHTINFGLFTPGLRNRKNALRSPLLSALFSKKNRSLKGIKTCNFALFRNDLLSVNGFDNRFVGWGREDSEFAARLLNAGAVRKNLKFAAVAYHLHHPENPRASLPENDERLRRSIEEKKVWCEDGIDRFIKEKR